MKDIKARNAILSAFFAFLLYISSPIKAPKKGPTINPKGGKKKIPIIIPTNDNLEAKALPPNFLVIIIGATKSNTVIIIAKANKIHILELDGKSEALLNLYIKTEIILKGGPGIAGKKAPKIPKIAIRITIIIIKTSMMHNNLCVKI